MIIKGSRKFGRAGAAVALAAALGCSSFALVAEAASNRVAGMSRHSALAAISRCLEFRTSSCHNSRTD